MAGGEATVSVLANLYQLVLSPFPPLVQNFINFLFIVLLFFFYSLFVWKFFYKFISKKNLLDLNLNQYNKSEHAFTSRTIAILLYFAEYILLIPFIVFFWFAFFTLFLILLSDPSMTVGLILIISAAVIGAIRICAYYDKSLAEDIAKMIPLTILAVLILNPASFSGDYIAQVIEKLNQVPIFFDKIIMYFFFIVFIEIILRVFKFFGYILGIEEELEEDSNF